MRYVVNEGFINEVKNKLDITLCWDEVDQVYLYEIVNCACFILFSPELKSSFVKFVYVENKKDNLLFTYHTVKSLGIVYNYAKEIELLWLSMGRSK